MRKWRGVAPDDHSGTGQSLVCRRFPCSLSARVADYPWILVCSGGVSIGQRSRPASIWGGTDEQMGVNRSRRRRSPPLSRRVSVGTQPDDFSLSPAIVQPDVPARVLTASCCTSCRCDVPFLRWKGQQLGGGAQAGSCPRLTFASTDGIFHLSHLSF